MEVQDSIVLFKKGIKNKYPLFDFIDNRIVPSHPVHLTVDHRIELYGYDINMLTDSIHIIFYWKLFAARRKGC